MQNERFAREVNADWERYFQRAIEPVLDGVLIKFNTLSDYVIIDSLDLDLGSIPEAPFRELLPILFKEKFEEILSAAFPTSSHTTPSARVSERVPNKHAFDLLAYFLLHGSLPWYTDTKYKNITLLFREVIRTSGKELKRFLQSYGHYSSLQERIVYQLNDPELEEGIRLSSPAESSFIISYVKLLISKRRIIAKPYIPETAHRNTVWRVVYAYLLTNRSSYFNKKAFVMSTMANLASSVNISYHDLLDILTEEMERLSETTVVRAELYRLLHELKSEATKERFRITATDAVKLYKSLEKIFSTQFLAQLQKPDIEALINILTRPDSGRLFLLQLSEEEIVRLVTIIIPYESEFVISYARSLDEQKEKGYLSGKAGHEFCKLKWQFIFPLLFENRGSTLNRKHFVRATIKQIAAHYNLDFTELLVYFNVEQALYQFDKELREILGILYSEMIPTKGGSDYLANAETVGAGKDLQIHTTVNIRSIDVNKINKRQKQILLAQLSKSNSRRHLLSVYTEEERQQLIRIFFDSESEFILTYASSLEKQEETNPLEGKAGGNFRQLKWEFIWTVLTQGHTTTFNRRYFIAGTLRKLAAHFNLGYPELLSYFCTNHNLRLFSAEIQTILNSLYREQIKELLQQAGSIANKATRHALLTLVTDKSISQTIAIYLQFLNTCKQAGLFTNGTASTFRTVVWEQVVSLLLLTENRKGYFDKQNFFKQLLLRIANYYQFPISKFITEMQRLRNIPADIQTILNALPDSETESISPSARSRKQPLSDSKIVSKQQTYKPIHEQKENPMKTIEIPNAGIVLLAPWFPRLYTMLGLFEENRFKNEEAQLKAIYLIQFAIFERTDFPEHELVLNKILVGLAINTAVPRSWELTVEEKRTTNSMVEGAKGNWPKLKNTSVAALREAFLQREGRLELKEDHYKLTVEEKAYDLLLDHLPWNFRMIKQAWMDKRIEVKWR